MRALQLNEVEVEGLQAGAAEVELRDFPHVVQRQALQGMVAEVEDRALTQVKERLLRLGSMSMREFVKRISGALSLCSCSRPILHSLVPCRFTTPSSSACVRAHVTVNVS